jgi:hypothetical protein
LQNQYEDFGMRRTVESVLLVHEHGHPHVLMIQIGELVAAGRRGEGKGAEGRRESGVEIDGIVLSSYFTGLDDDHRSVCVLQAVSSCSYPFSRGATTLIQLPLAPPPPPPPVPATTSVQAKTSSPVSPPVSTLVSNPHPMNPNPTVLPARAEINPTINGRLEIV